MRVPLRHRRMSLIRMMTCGDGDTNIIMMGRSCRMVGNHVRDMQSRRECRNGNESQVRMHMNDNLNPKGRRRSLRARRMVPRHRECVTIFAVGRKGVGFCIALNYSRDKIHLENSDVMRTHSMCFIPKHSIELP
jgi:hypothetical protein